METFDNTTNINGPINLVRLEGKLGKITKVLYVFFDFHIRDTRCADEFSLDIDQYIIREFKKMEKSDSKLVHDFYLEKPLFILNQNKPIRDNNYIGDLAVTLSNYLDYEPNKDVMKISKLGKNLRIHLVDMRNNILSDIQNEFSYALHDLSSAYINQTINDLMRIIDDLPILQEIVKNESKSDIPPKKLVELLKNIKTNTQITSAELNIYLMKLINKMYHQYKHSDVKSIIGKELKQKVNKINEIKVRIHDLTEKIIIFNNHVIQSQENKICIQNTCNYGVPFSISKEKQAEHYTILDEIYISYLEVFSGIMDLYFIRRFLDKDYATNGIFYGGAFHSTDITRYLVKDFGFKITHFVKSEITDLNKLNKAIKDSKTVDDAMKILYPNELIQCVSMKSFPTNFL